jgi:L-glyceraldehyde 3-phosphate reductase
MVGQAACAILFLGSFARESLASSAREEEEIEGMSYVPDAKRYDGAQFRRCGRSGIVLPPVSLGLWQNFGGADVFETGRAVIRRAFDRGVTHFDLANNYGPPYGSAEENFGTILRKDFCGLRNELVISTKAGWDMWPGPYGIGASRKYMLASLDDSLKRMGLEYVDIFYAHRPWLDVPLEETMGALVSAVHQGKALYVGISSYSPERTREAAKILRSMGVPLLIHQPSYSMLNRWIEKELLGTLDELGVGCIAFSPLAQGLLTNKYLHGVPADSRATAENSSLLKEFLSEDNLKRTRALNEIAKGRGQSLAQMAIAWVLRDKRVTSALIGARNVEQLDNSLDAIRKLEFSDAELKEIDRYAQEGAIDLWKGARETMQ